MKKSVFFSVLMLGALVLAGCENSNETPATTTTELWPAYDSSVGLYGYINRKGDWAIPAQYTAATSYFSCGVARVELSGKPVFIDKNGKIKMSASFDNAGEFYYGYALASLNGQLGLINSKLEYAIDPAYSYLSNMTTDGIVTFKADNSHYGFLDKSGNVIMKDKKPVYYESADYFRDGYCVVCDDMSRQDRYGDSRIPTYYLVNTKFAPVIEDGKYMSMSNLGKGLVAVVPYSKSNDETEYEIYSVKDKSTITSKKYSAVSSFSADGYAKVGQGDYYHGMEWGVIDTKGNIVMSVDYDDLGDSYEGYIWVYDDDEVYLADLSKSGSRVLGLVHEEKEREIPMSNVHKGLVLIVKQSYDRQGDYEIEYRWVDVKNGNKPVFSWKYDKDSKHKGDLHPNYAPAKASELGATVYLH